MEERKIVVVARESGNSVAMVSLVAVIAIAALIALFVWQPWSTAWHPNTTNTTSDAATSGSAR